MEAVAINARTLHLDEAAVRQGERMRTPGQRASVPIALGPVPLQHQISHDLLYDTIPHPRIRQNIMAAIISGRLDQAALSSCIRASGALVFWQGTWQRRGLVVWGDASCISSWELTEGFVRTFGFLLEGCDDFLAATNTWRAMRGEAPITL
ncbi:hypothetical protein K431DRAFT_288328 [Polychaeton citri CBS 116435]|uniref:Uncharacterized protein n=1 Tax=Polychaeton citri CBS 116435 TaxID=1314669 RepID=A0A9P4UJ94_9PEZI|nr:hypothetical protein K431DRAFT_288328 [Polychaeton citri CBS 116435]